MSHSQGQIPMGYETQPPRESERETICSYEPMEAADKVMFALLALLSLAGLVAFGAITHHAQPWTAAYVVASFAALCTGCLFAFCVLVLSGDA